MLIATENKKTLLILDGSLAKSSKKVRTLIEKHPEVFVCLIFSSVVCYLTKSFSICRLSCVYLIQLLNHFVKRVLLLSLNIKRKSLGRKKKKPSSVSNV